MAKSVIWLALGLAGCQASLPADAPVGAQASGTSKPGRSAAGLEVVPLTITSGGRTHRFQVEVARTEAQQSRGMMFRDRLAPNRGMMFPFAVPRRASFWMRDTPNSLDLIFVGTDGRIESIAADAVPMNETPMTSIGVVAGVLEIAGGRAAELGLQPGDRVSWGG